MSTRRHYITLLTPIDEDRSSTLLRLREIAAAAGVGFMLVGAFARDIFFISGHGLPVRRNTTDLDFALQLDNWREYEQFRSCLCSSEFAQSSSDHPERLVDRNGVCVDLIPFGNVSNDGTMLAWPDGASWTILGFQEAFDHALWIEVKQESVTQDIRIASPPALVMLKLISAHDRLTDPARIDTDSRDIDFIAKDYLNAGNRARLVDGPDADLMDAEILDLEVTGARLIGRDIGELASSPTRQRILDILEQETTSRSRCPITHKMRACNNGDFGRARNLLLAIQEGLRERDTGSRVPGSRVPGSSQGHQA